MFSINLLLEKLARNRTSYDAAVEVTELHNKITFLLGLRKLFLVYLSKAN
jgi:hypothetical protein